MAGWSRKKRSAVEKAFYEFLNRCYINSKDSGQICLGKSLFQGQIDVITEIFDALEEDIHDIYILKSRQLGISTLIRAVIIFFLGIFKGLKGAIVLDTSDNKLEARAEIEVMINDLPQNLGFSSIKGNNRQGLTLSNDSKVLFMSAGVKKSKTSGTLGRSVGISLATLSELCSYDNDEGLESFENSLSDMNPDRLYIRESTARGFNSWWITWKEARADPAHKRCIFIGWWSKDSQRIERDDRDFQLYGLEPPTEDEAKKIKEVAERYGVHVSQEQLAWYRKKMNPSFGQGDETQPVTNQSLRIQEQPWTEDEAFQQTGAVFFAAENLTDLTNKYVSRKYKPYMFMVGEEFYDMKIYRADNTRSIELKVWEEPQPEGCYVVGVDPAFGENENNCNSAIQVLRCYADGVDQVAEYAWPLVTTRHLAWVLTAIMGWYGGSPRAEVRYILELNGPGESTYNAVKALKFYIENAGYARKDFDDKGLLDVFQNVRTYIFTRPDAMGPGFNWHWKTNTQLKITLMEQLRDIASAGKLRIRSLDLIEEMRSISREGDSIGAPSSMRDDRAIAMALANYYWQTKIRNGLISLKRTRAHEESRQHMSIVDQAGLFQQNMLENMFRQKHAARQVNWRQALHANWRNGSGRRY